MQKPKDLMELVDECAVLDNPGWNGKEIPEAIEGLQDLGFVAALSEWEEANPDHKKSKLHRIYDLEYKTITDEAIQKFLKRKATIYDAEHKPKIENHGKHGPDLSILADAIRERANQQGFFESFIHVDAWEPILQMPESDDFTINTIRAAKAKLRVQPADPDREINEVEQEMRLMEQIQREWAVPPRLMGMVQNAESAQMQVSRDQARALLSVNHNSNPQWIFRREPDVPTVIDSPLDGTGYMRQDYTDNTEAMPTFVEKTCDYDLTKEGTIGKFEWTEVPVEEYEGLPPKRVLETFKKHKERKVFDYFTIASVEGIKDPLLLGRLNGERSKRWFIAQWGIDVSLDDLI